MISIKTRTIRRYGMLLFILFLLFCGNLSWGQTWKEWMRQKKTKKEYLLAQIAALEVYGSAIRKGYRIAREGLDDVGELKRLLGLEDARHFQEMQTVDLDHSSRVRLQRALKRYRQLPAIRVHIIQGLNRNRIAAGNRTYIIDLMDKTASDLNQCFQEMHTLLQPGSLQMPPAARSQRAGEILTRIERHIARLGTLRVLVFKLHLERSNGNRSIRQIRALHGMQDLKENEQTIKTKTETKNE